MQHNGGSAAHLRAAPAAPLTVKPQAQPQRGPVAGGGGGDEDGEEESGSEEDDDEEEGSSGSGSDDDDDDDEEDETEATSKPGAAAGAAAAAAPLPSAGLKSGFSWAQAVKTAAPPAPTAAQVR